MKKQPVRHWQGIGVGRFGVYLFCGIRKPLDPPALETKRSRVTCKLCLKKLMKAMLP